jgi:hypothetical protein
MKNTILFCLIVLVFSCKKHEVKRQPEVCNFQTNEKPKRHIPGSISFTTANKLPAVIFLDFDGHFVVNTPWNWNGPFTCLNSGLDSAQQKSVFDSVVYDFAQFAITITTDSMVYRNASEHRRQRIVITQSSEWYGNAGGTSYLNTFVTGDSIPSFVFTNMLGFTVKKIAEATSHEAGHTMGLYHQSEWVNGSKVNEYFDGGVNLNAPIMGLSYYKTGVWWTGTNANGDAQNDAWIIYRTIK